MINDDEYEECHRRLSGVNLKIKKMSGDVGWMHAKKKNWEPSLLLVRPFKKYFYLPIPFMSS